MNALKLIELCAREYQDVAYGRIAKLTWLAWLNDGQRTIALVRPDASAVTENLTLVAGTKQAVPATRSRILAVTRNMGGDGATPGKVLRFVSREDLDAVNENWHTATPASPVRAVVYDDKKDPATFWVSPPALANWRIEATMAAEPTDVPDADVDTDDITLPSVYAAPLQQWMLFRAYMLNSQSQGNLQRGQTAFSAFFNLLGVKLRAELWNAALGSPQLPPMRTQ